MSKSNRNFIKVGENNESLEKKDWVRTCVLLEKETYDDLKDLAMKDKECRGKYLVLARKIFKEYIDRKKIDILEIKS